MSTVIPGGEAVQDITAICACTLCLCCLRRVFVNSFGSNAVAKLAKASPWGNAHATALFKGCYFILACATWWYLFGNKSWPFLPFGVPCVGTAANHYCDPNPYATRANIIVAVGAHSELRTYYIIQMAYHLHSTLFHFTLPRRPDFVAMALHHGFTLALVMCSFALNDWYMAFGSFVLFANDGADIASYGLKVAEGVGRVSVILPTYVFVLLCWAYFRLYALPYVSIWLTTSRLTPMDLMLWEAGLCALHVLHLYWFWKVLAMGIGYARHGEVKDRITGPGSSTKKSNKKLI